MVFTLRGWGEGVRFGVGGSVHGLCGWLNRSPLSPSVKYEGKLIATRGLCQAFVMESPSALSPSDPRRCVSPTVALQKSPTKQHGDASMEVDQDKDLPAPSRPVAAAPVPEGPERPEKNGKKPLLSSSSGIDADEEYSRDEQMLNEFVKLHPMLSLQATSATTLQLVSGMLEKAHVKVPELEIVPKSHDDLFLTEANSTIGERPCVCGTRCLANFMAKIRYGKDTDKGFVCKEFLLPSQYKDFLEGKGLPETHQKCLICTRYWQVCPTPHLLPYPHVLVHQFQCLH